MAWICSCSRCDPDIPNGKRCLCPGKIIHHANGNSWHGILAGHTDGCPIHIKPGCPGCGETWILSFHWPTCDACGWSAPLIEEIPTALDLSA